tara:strand:+ start:733 stop:1335 length:603 start_codon:yes stop_codon:yes gene_type:complete
MNLQEMIDDNIAVLEAESNHKEMLAKEKLQRQREALIEIRDEIKPAIEEAGYSIELWKNSEVFARKIRTYEESCQQSKKQACFLKIEFEDSRHLKNTGESESFYSPRSKYAGQHCGGSASAYIKIVWDDDKGLYHIIPNVAFAVNKEVKELDPLTYQELKGTKEMIIERLAIVLANAMQYEKREAECFAKHQAWKESLNG